MTQAAKVGVIMGSQSDWPTMKHSCDVLTELGVPHAAQIVSAHRTPDRLCRVRQIGAATAGCA